MHNPSSRKHSERASRLTCASLEVWPFETWRGIVRDLGVFESSKPKLRFFRFLSIELQCSLTLNPVSYFGLERTMMRSLSVAGWMTVSESCKADTLNLNPLCPGWWNDTSSMRNLKYALLWWGHSAGLGVSWVKSFTGFSIGFPLVPPGILLRRSLWKFNAYSGAGKQSSYKSSTINGTGVGDSTISPSSFLSETMTSRPELLVPHLPNQTYPSSVRTACWFFRKSGSIAKENFVTL